MRRYNCTFAFASVKCNTTNRGAGPGGPICFQIHGALYHNTGPLEEAAGCLPAFAQVYFYDPHAATNFRFLSNDCLDRDILTALGDFLHSNNPLARLYRTARERFHQASTVVASRILLNPQMRLIVQTSGDQRRENLPTVDDVALIIPNEYAEAWKVMMQPVPPLCSAHCKLYSGDHSG